MNWSLNRQTSQILSCFHFRQEVESDVDVVSPKNTIKYSFHWLIYGQDSMTDWTGTASFYELVLYNLAELDLNVTVLWKSGRSKIYIITPSLTNTLVSDSRNF